MKGFCGFFYPRRRKRSWKSGWNVTLGGNGLVGVIRMYGALLIGE